MPKSILFIIPGFFYIEDYQKLLYYNDIPLGTLQISSYLKEKANVKTNIIDMRLEGEKNGALATKELKKDEFKNAVIRVLERENIEEYQYIGINCYTSFHYHQTQLIAKIIKENFRQINLVVGGYHPTAVPEDFSYNNSPFDFIIRGEAEISLTNLLTSNAKRGTNKNQPLVLSPEELIDVNSLPFPDYELYLQKYPYKDRFKFEFYISRGCPYQCAFCATNYDFRSYNFKNFKIYFENLCEIVQNYNSKNFKIGFADQSFDQVLISEKVLDYIVSNGFQDRFAFSCQGRVEVALENPKIYEKLVKCKMVVGYGLETVNKDLLKEMHKTETPTKYVEIMSETIEKYKTYSDIYCRLNLLIGFPGETQETFDETVNFLNRNAIHENIQVSPTLFSNYPNVFVYKNMEYYEKKFGTKFIKNWWKLESNSFKNAVPQMPSKNFSLKQILGEYRDKYSSILKASKRNTPSELLIWKEFYNNWYNDL